MFFKYAQVTSRPCKSTKKALDPIYKDSGSNEIRIADWQDL